MGDKVIKIKVFQNKETKRYFSNFTKHGTAETVLKPEYAKVWVVRNEKRMGNLRIYKRNNHERLTELGFELVDVEVSELL